jgi:ubiquinone/menaquinone biosynthesis C-methylase UbiE
MNPTALGRFVTPATVSSHFHFKPGDAVADFGAGSGFYLPLLAAMVAPDGQVVACEIQKNLVEKLADLVRVQGLSRVTPLWCDLEEPEGCQLRDGMLDGGILVNTLFQLEDKHTALTEIRRVLRTGAVLHIVDWTESWGGLGPAPQHVVPLSAAIELGEAHRFLFEREYPAGDHHYGAAFRAV